MTMTLSSMLRATITPYSSLREIIERCTDYLPPLLAEELSDRAKSVKILESALSAIVFHPDGTVTDYGVISRKAVTDAGVAFLVDAWQGTVELEVLRYHGIGTGTNAESVTDTALQTEATTALSTDNTRATGTLTEGASANIFRSVATITVDATVAVTEHGLFSQAATGGGTLWDRSVFPVMTLTAGSAIQFTYEVTVNAGG